MNSQKALRYSTSARLSLSRNFAPNSTPACPVPAKCRSRSRSRFFVSGIIKNLYSKPSIQSSLVQFPISVKMLSLLNLGSFAHSTRNSSSASALFAWPRGGGTKTGSALADLGCCTVWQNAQFVPTRGYPMTTFVRPMGNSLPCCQGRPNEVYPARPGNFSENILVITYNI